VHGNTLVDTLNCSVRHRLLGGTQFTNGMTQRASAPAFDVAIELHQKDRWILHPNVRYTVDTYLQGRPVEAVEMRPGLAIATMGIPVECGLNYCYNCTADQRCSLHQPSRAPSPAPVSGALGRLPTSASLLVDGSSQSPRASAKASSSRPYTPRGANSQSPHADGSGVSIDKDLQRSQSAYAKRGGAAPANSFGVRSSSLERDPFGTTPRGNPHGGPASSQGGPSSNKANSSVVFPPYEREGYSLKAGSYRDAGGPKKRPLR
jgi:hypothetical protein